MIESYHYQSTPKMLRDTPYDEEAAQLVIERESSEGSDLEVAALTFSASSFGEQKSSEALPAAMTDGQSRTRPGRVQLVLWMVINTLATIAIVIIAFAYCCHSNTDATTRFSPTIAFFMTRPSTTPSCLLLVSTSS